MSKKKILVIEDDPDQIVMIKARLEFAGYEFISAKDGEEGLKKVLQEKPDLVLLDILLPKMEGEEVCEKIRSDPKTRNTPIIIVTGVDADGLKKRCLVVGAEDWIQKPYDPKELLTKIEKLIGCLKEGKK